MSTKEAYRQYYLKSQSKLDDILKFINMIESTYEKEHWEFTKTEKFVLMTIRGYIEGYIYGKHKNND